MTILKLPFKLLALPVAFALPFAAGGVFGVVDALSDSPWDFIKS